MRTNPIIIIGIALLGIPLIQQSSAVAEDAHGSQLFHRFQLETDVGVESEGALATWDFDGWVGGDVNKVWLKSEGDFADGDLNKSEFWLLYSRSIDTFWDFQLGVRDDVQPSSFTFLTVGLNGLAPYYFDTEAHIFLSDEGDFSARFRQENDLLLTQRLRMEPYFEFNFYAQDVSELETGAGLSDGQLGLQLRYEISRSFAPYIDFSYERKIGETSAIARSNGDSRDDVIASLGLRLVF